MESALLVMVQNGLLGDASPIADLLFQLADLGRQGLALLGRRRLAGFPDLRGRWPTGAPRPKAGIGQVAGGVQICAGPGPFEAGAVGRILPPRFQRTDAGFNGLIISRPPRRRIEGPHLPTGQKPLQVVGAKGRTVIPFQDQGAPATVNRRRSTGMTTAAPGDDTGSQANCRPLARSRTANT
jgi:hypothetical protein